MTPPLRLFDRYVIGYFIRYLLFSLLAASVIFIVVDLIEHLDKFIDKKVSLSIVLLYYGYFLPYIVYLVLPVSALLASLFTVGGLSRSHELSAMKASGIGLHRILLHLAALGVLLSAGNFLFGETIVPYTNKQNKDIYRYQVKGVSPDQAARSGNIYLRNRPGELVQIKHYDPASETAYDLDWVRLKNQDIKERLSARKAVWEDSAWVVENGRQWFFYSDSVAYRSIPNQPFYDLGFKPADLVKVQTEPDEMDYWQLGSYIARLRQMGGDPLKWSVDLAFKVSMPWTCAIVILLGVPIAAHYRRSGIALTFGIGLFISFVYFALQQIGRVMGFNGVLGPWEAAWVGNVVFLGVGLVLYWRVGK